jgi:hypothetical protein
MDKTKIMNQIITIERNAQLVEEFLKGLKHMGDKDGSVDTAIKRLYDIRNTHTSIIISELAL